MPIRSASHRWIYLLLLAGAGLVAIEAPARAEPVDTCALPTPTSTGTPANATQTATVTGITGPNSFRLSTGQEIRLASVTTPRRMQLPPALPEPASDPQTASAEDPADEMSDDTLPVNDETPPDAPAIDPIQASRSALRDWLLGRDVRLYPVTPQPDRYGRLRAAVARTADGLWIEAELVSHGLARVQPQTDDFACARHLEAIEATARAARLGLWSLPEFAVLDADDPARTRWSGRYVLIEGKIVSVRTSGARRYLNFGKNFSRDFAIMLVNKGATTQSKAKRQPSRFRAAGFESEAAVGRRVRVRGILTKGTGGFILPSTPEEIEWADDAH